MRLTDIELMLRAKAGEATAFHELARRYREPPRRYFAALIADASQADDFAQETLLRLWLARRSYEPTGRFSTYLFQIGKHYWLNQRRKFRPISSLDSLDETLLIDARPASQPQTVLLQQYQNRRIRRAIAALPEHYRLVFTLCHLEGWRYAEIAERLGLPLGTVKSRMAAAVCRLRRALTADEE